MDKTSIQKEAEDLEEFRIAGNIPRCQIKGCQKKAENYFLGKDNVLKFFCFLHFMEITEINAVKK